MRISTPTAYKNTTNEEPPLLMNGKGNPVGGILPVTTATLSNVWQAIKKKSKEMRKLEVHYFNLGIVEAER